MGDFFEWYSRRPKPSAVLFTPKRIVKPLVLECWGGPCDGQVFTVAPNTVTRALGEPDGALVWHVEPYTKQVLEDGGIYEVYHRWDKDKENRGLVLKWIP